MATAIIQTTVTITAMECPVCGVHYGLDEGFRRLAFREGKSKYKWYCTNGHTLVYGHVSEAEARLTKQLEQAEARLEAEQGWSQRLHNDLDAERKQHASTKGQLTRTRNRANAGVCLDCHRTFVNVAKHRRDKHGDSDKATGARPEMAQFAKRRKE